MFGTNSEQLLEILGTNGKENGALMSFSSQLSFKWAFIIPVFGELRGKERIRVIIYDIFTHV